MESSNYSHKYTYANYKGKAITTGYGSSNTNYSFMTELFDLYTMEWSDSSDISFSSKKVSKYHFIN